MHHETSLVATIAVGPFTPGFVADVKLAPQLAEIGVILLMFGVGMHFSVRQLLEVRGIALSGAVAQIVVATGLGVGVATLGGWSLGSTLVFGLALSVASTAVLVRALAARGRLDTDDGRIAVGWLIVEDLVMVLILVLLPPLAGHLGGQAIGHGAEPAGLLASGGLLASYGLWASLGLTLGKMAVFIALMLLVGTRLFPWLLARVENTGSRELFTLAVVALALGIAFGAARLFRVLAVVAIIVVGNSLAALGIVLVLRHSLKTAPSVSAALAQIGEFSFILAGLGVTPGLLPAEGPSLIVAGALLSITLNPLVFHAVDKWSPAESSA